MSSVSVSDLASATSILVAVCLSVGLILAALCRLLTSFRYNVTLAQDHTSSWSEPTYVQHQQQQQQQCVSETEPTTVDEQTRSLCQLSDETNTLLRAADETACHPDKAPTTDTNTNVASEEASWMSMNTSGGATIQRALSCDSVLSDTSVTELDTADETTHRVGQLEFSLQYIRESEELVIMVIQARDLERDQVTGSLDSYVRVSLSPHHGSRSQTRVVRDTVHPQFMDSFSYNISPQTLVRTDDTSTSPLVQFQVYSCDKYARHRLLGETEFRLSDIDFHSQQTVRVWMNLHEIDEKPMERGDILLSLSYLPTAERLILVIVKARNLCLPLTKPAADCCFKVYQTQKGTRIAKKKTSYKRDDRNPIFNEAMVFSLPHKLIETVQLKISAIAVLPGDRGATCVGHVTLGPHMTGTQLVHWTQSMTSLRRPVTMWHSLR